ncbi:MAG: hypothetical protein RSB82_04280 [Victivallaceae bacterium]
MDILIYSGAGVSGYLLRHVFRFFSRFILDVNRYSIKRVQADYLIGGGLLVFVQEVMFVVPLSISIFRV